MTHILLSWVDVNTLIWMNADNQMLQLLNIKFQLNVTLCFEMVVQDEFLHVKS